MTDREIVRERGLVDDDDDDDCNGDDSNDENIRLEGCNSVCKTISELHIYTYGRSVGSGSRRRIGGYAFASACSSSTVGPYSNWVTSGHITNQLMELAAASAALRAIDQGLHPGQPIVLVTTSHYVMNCMTLWLPRWQRTGWVTKQQRIVQNCATLREMARITARFGVKYERKDAAIGESDDKIDPNLAHVKRLVDQAIHDADQSGCSKRHNVVCVWMG